MIRIYCTAPLVKRFRLRVESLESGSTTTRLGAWYATVLNAGPRRLVVWLNESSNLTVVTRARQGDFPTEFPLRLAELLLRLGIPAELAAAERLASTDCAFVRARDRSLLGSLRDAVLRVRWDLERGLSVGAIEDHMAEMPARAKAFLFPREVAFKQFGLPQSSPLPDSFE